MSAGKKVVDKLSKTYSQSSDNYWLRGLIEMVPYVGGTLDTWFFQFAEKEKQKRVEQSLDKLTNRLNTLEDQIDVKYIEENVEEYAFLFEKFLRYVSQEYRKELRDKFSILMSNLTTRTYSQQKKQRCLFINIVRDHARSFSYTTIGIRLQLCGWETGS